MFSFDLRDFPEQTFKIEFDDRYVARVVRLFSIPSLNSQPELPLVIALPISRCASQIRMITRSHFGGELGISLFLISRK